MSNQNGLYAAVSGAIAQQKRLEVVTNNLANVNTTGYKKDVLSFQSLLTASEKRLGVAALAAVSEFRTDHSQGSLQNTRNPLDLSIRGQGFFEVLTEEGPRYTRQGNFTLDGSNQLVTAHGHPVSGTGGPLVLDGAHIAVGADGEITVDQSSAGKLRVVEILDTRNMEKAGDGLFRNIGGEDNVTESTEPQVHQGYLERSNVNQIEEMVQLIQVSRAYESYQKMIQSVDDATKKLVNEVGKP